MNMCGLIFMSWSAMASLAVLPPRLRVLVGGRRPCPCRAWRHAAGRSGMPCEPCCARAAGIAKTTDNPNRTCIFFGILMMASLHILRASALKYFRLTWMLRYR